jgi:hypothetical protein
MLPIRAFQWDLARQVERLGFLLRWLPRYAEWGYQELYLHLEDAVEFPSIPTVARPDAYSYQQFARLVEAATVAGIRVVPIVNLLGHTQYLIKTPELRDLNELRDDDGQPLTHGQICPLHPRTLEIAEKLLRDMAPFCTAGKVHVGLDESFHLGQCPRCRAEVARVGLASHFAGHVNRLHQLTQSFGLRLGLWADMLALLPAAIPRLPPDVIAYDWYYYPFARHPRVELHNFAEIDLATPLRAQGVEYWGCPMNGGFRYEPMPVFGERMANIVSWWRRCQRVGAEGFLMTSWEPSRLAMELATAVDAAAASLWLDPEVDDPRAMLARGFARVFGRGVGNAKVGRVIPNAPGHLQGHARRVKDNPPYPPDVRRWAQAALAADAFPFSGYHRWQINDRWDVCLGRDGVAPYVSEEKTLQKIGGHLLAGDSTDHRLQAGSYKGPPPALAASLAFRLYLARRDVFVRRAAEAVFQLRRDLVRGGTGLPTRDSSLMDREVHATQNRAALQELRRQATAFAAALRAGRAAARAMWNRSRDPRDRGPNELMLRRDADHLREWRLWLKRASRNLGLLWQATPVCGAWQLQFTVHNFAPALQKVVVEQQQPDGSWALLHGLHLIEFRESAAHPRTRIKREFSVPVPEPLRMVGRVIPNAPLASPEPGGGGRRLGDKPPYPPTAIPLRLAVRGVGQIAISHVELTNGVVRLASQGWPPARRRTFGQPAPHRGVPELDWTENQGEMVLRFA